MPLRADALRGWPTELRARFFASPRTSARLSISDREGMRRRRHGFGR